MTIYVTEDQVYELVCDDKKHPSYKRLEDIYDSFSTRPTKKNKDSDKELDSFCCGKMRKNSEKELAFTVALLNYIISGNGEDEDPYDDLDENYGDKMFLTMLAATVITPEEVPRWSIRKKI